MSVLALDFWPKVEIPDRIGFVTAYRTWTVIKDQGSYRLASSGVVGRHCIWPVGTPLEARCHRFDYPEPSICAERCKNGWQFGRCGIYGLKCKEEEMFRAMLSYPQSYGISIIGSVALWGVVLEHERGYRAQYAYPLWIARKVGPTDALCNIARDYGIPLEEWREP